MPPENDLARNLAALRGVDPALAERIARASVPPEWVVESLAGPPVLRVPDERGRPILLASRNDPAAEVTAQVSAFPVEGVAACIVYGLAGGAHVAELLARLSPACRLAVFEPLIETARFALQRHDWAEALRERRLSLLVGADRPQVIEILKAHTLHFFARTEVYAHPASQRAFPAFYARMREAVEAFFSFGRMNLYTLAGISRVTTLNICMNLPAYAASPGVADLAGRARGHPAILVGAGPSLARNIHRLAEAARGAVVISVPTVFRTLLDRGIAPDFVTTLDYHKISAKYFEGTGGAEGTATDATLVCDPKVSYAVVDTWRGRRCFAAHPLLSELLEEPPGARGTFRWGATVAHLSLYLAEHLGADPIIFVGQDLCYPYGVTHVPGTAIHENWVPELNRFSTFEMKEWETLLRIRPILRKARDVDGNPVYTDEQMFSYLLRFEEDFARSPARIIDATEGGLEKRGATRMPLAEAIDRFCRGNPFPRERLRTLEADPASAHARLAEARARTRDADARLAAVAAYYDETLERLAAVQRSLAQGSPSAEAIREVRKWADRIGQHQREHKWVSGLAQIDEFNRVKADLEIACSRFPPEERQRRELARDLDYLRGSRAAAETLRAFLKVALERLDAALDGEEPDRRESEEEAL